MGMCKHKDKEQALIDEIDRLMAKTEKDDEDGEPLAEQLKSYVYVEACVKEALRMVGPGAFLARLSSKGTETYDLQNHKAFMPFGLGPRMCVAWNFAMTEA